MSEDEIINFNVMNVPKMSKQGYILDVNLCYLSSIHNTHSDLPLRF